LITAKSAKIAKVRKGFSLKLLCDFFVLLAALAVEIGFRNKH
jgi:hypothetical protein